MKSFGAILCLALLIFSCRTQESGNILMVRIQYLTQQNVPKGALYVGSSSGMDVVIQCLTGSNCAVTGKQYNAGGGDPPDPGVSCKLKSKISKNAVQTLIPAMQTNLQPVSEPVKRIVDTGYQTRREIKIDLDNGSWQILNTSDSTDKDTWNIQHSSQWAVQTSNAFKNALGGLLKTLGSWKCLRPK